MTPLQTHWAENNNNCSLPHKHKPATLSTSIQDSQCTPSCFVISCPVLSCCLTVYLPGECLKSTLEGQSRSNGRKTTDLRTDRSCTETVKTWELFWGPFPSQAGYVLTMPIWINLCYLQPHCFTRTGNVRYGDVMKRNEQQVVWVHSTVCGSPVWRARNAKLHSQIPGVSIHSPSLPKRGEHLT